MLKQESAEFAKLITGIGEIYRWEFSPQVIEIYWRVLEPFSLEDVKAAVYRHIQDPDVGKFLPKPADIIMAKEFQERYRGYVRKRPSSHPKYLEGRLELQNNSYGYTPPTPVLIGNKLKAQEVIATGEDKSFFTLTYEQPALTIKTANLIQPLNKENND